MIKNFFPAICILVLSPLLIIQSEQEQIKTACGFVT